VYGKFGTGCHSRRNGNSVDLSGSGSSTSDLISTRSYQILDSWGILCGWHGRGFLLPRTRGRSGQAGRGRRASSGGVLRPHAGIREAIVIVMVLLVAVAVGGGVPPSHDAEQTRHRCIYVLLLSAVLLPFRAVKGD